MTSTFVRQPRVSRSLLANIAGCLALVTAVNAPIFLLGWSEAATTRSTSPLDPPGAVVGAVWTLLFAGFGAARWRLLNHTGTETTSARDARRWLDGLVVACAAWPFFTLLPGSETAALIGNLAIIGLATIVTTRIAKVDRPATIATAAMIGWVGFASIVTAQNLGII
jgi:tryptophan-rich sensory protein